MVIYSGSGITVHPGDGAPIEYMEATAGGGLRLLPEHGGDLCPGRRRRLHELIVQAHPRRRPSSRSKQVIRVITRDRAICTWCLLNSERKVDERTIRDSSSSQPIFPLQTLSQ